MTANTRGARSLGRVGLGLFLLASGCNAPPSAPAIAAWPTGEWVRAEPEAVGFSSATLAEALAQAEADDLHVNGIFVARYGHELLRAQLHPYDGRRHDVASVTKTVTATLIGVALERGDLPGLDARVIELLGEQGLESVDDRKREITVEDLLTMRSGLDCGVLDGEVEVTQMLASEDWVGFALALPMRTEPGTEFAYCSPNTHLLSAIVTAVSGASALDYARAHLFDPLGIEDLDWPADPQGISHGWGNLQLRPEDMAKIAYLYLRGGEWDGARILPAEFVSAAWTIHAEHTSDPAAGYGYGWWIPTGELDGVYEARGRGGQAITVWPEADVVVAWTGRGRDDRDALVEPLVAAMIGVAAVPEDPAGVEALATVLAELAAPPAPLPVPALPELAAELSQIEFDVADNPLGLGGLRLEFEDGAAEALAVFVIDGEAHALAVGLDGVQRFSPGPRGLEVGMIGAWTGDATLELGFHERAGPEHLLMTLEFEDAQHGTLTLRDPGGYRPEIVVALAAAP